MKTCCQEIAQKKTPLENPEVSSLSKNCIFNPHPHLLLPVALWLLLCQLDHE